MKKLMRCFACTAIFCLPIVVSGEFSTEADQVLERARQGNAEAQFEVGTHYLNGTGGVSTNAEEAVKWFRLAVEQGNVTAECSLGVCFYYGDGVPKDQKIATKWFRSAAEQGNAAAQFYLGRCYLLGEGITENNTEAAKWFRLAADQGHVGAQSLLGTCYAHGQGVGEDDAEAVKWYRLAADKGNADAQFDLGLCYGRGEGVATNHQEAIRWFRLAAEQGHADAQYALYNCSVYLDDSGIDHDEQMKWLRMAAQQGHADAQYRLGRWCYTSVDEQGKTVAQSFEDDAEAFKWFMLAAQQGHLMAQCALGECYAKGKGTAKDQKESTRWYKLAWEKDKSQVEFPWLSASPGEFYCFMAEQGNPEYQYLAGVQYLGGGIFGGEKDAKEAVKWLRRAAEQGHATAQFNLGNCYYNGEGVWRDYKEAVKWYQLAAEQGHDGAQCNLGVCYANGKGVLEDYVEAYAWYTVAAMNDNSEEVVGNKERLKNKLNGLQIAAGQERAKELQAMIDRKRKVTALGKNEMPAADIAPAGSGSGLLVKGGYVLTCWHVVEKGQKVTVACGGKDYAATVVQKDPANDIAILRVSDAPGGIPLSLADSKLGGNVFTMGFPHPDLQGSDVKYTTGSISGLTGPGNTPVYYQISAPLQSGNSGGPLFDEYGNLVGIVAAKLDSLKMLAATGDLTQNVNYAIKSDYLIPLLKTVDGIKIQPPQTKPVNLLSLVEELKKSVVMIKVY